jgi:hypothetical protein
MEFYKLFRFRGTIGVNKLSLGDMIGVEIAMIFFYVALASILALISPTILFTFYVLWLFTGNGGNGHDGRNCLQRLWVNIFTIVSVVYYILDFHYGWLSHHVMSSVMSAETLHGIAKYNLTLGLLSLIFLFVGHEIYRIVDEYILRILLFCVVIYIGYLFISLFSDYILTDIITQHVKEIVVE